MEINFGPKYGPRKKTWKETEEEITEIMKSIKINEPIQFKPTRTDSLTDEESKQCAELNKVARELKSFIDSTYKGKWEELKDQIGNLRTPYRLDIKGYEQGFDEALEGVLNTMATLEEK